MAFLRNAWYCAGFGSQLGAAAVARTIMEEPIALYRDEEGKAVAIGGRCPHRFAPLAQGRVLDGVLTCPYHGLGFAADGLCVSNPHGDGAIPPKSGVPAYPLIERDGILWIWMGAAAKADLGSIPLLPFVADSSFRTIEDSLEVAANYRLIMDNLLDLSHAPFIHPTTLSSAGAIFSPRNYHRVDQVGMTVRSEFLFAELPPPAQQRPLIEYEIADNWVRMDWNAPANLIMVGTVQPCGAEPRSDLILHMAHLLTPIDEQRTAYHFLFGRNRLQDDAAQDVFQRNVLRQAFEVEDTPMIEACQRMMGDAELMDLKPLILRGDSAAIRARRLLDQMVRAEITS